jgi:hypothetical protein
MPGAYWKCRREGVSRDLRNHAHSIPFDQLVLLLVFKRLPISLQSNQQGYLHRLSLCLRHYPGSDFQPHTRSIRHGFPNSRSTRKDNSRSACGHRRFARSPNTPARIRCRKAPEILRESEVVISSPPAGKLMNRLRASVRPNFRFQSSGFLTLVGSRFCSTPTNSPPISFCPLLRLQVRYFLSALPSSAPGESRWPTTHESFPDLRTIPPSRKWPT